MTRNSLGWSFCVLFAVTCGLVLAESGDVLCQMPSCSQPARTNNGWHTRTVYYRLDSVSFTPTERAALKRAFDNWTAFNQNNTSKVVFKDISTAPQGTTPHMTVEVATGSLLQNGEYAAARTASTTVGGQVIGARTRIDLANRTPLPTAACQTTAGSQFEGPCKMWDPSRNHYLEAVEQVMMHEIGHTMGLADIDVTKPQLPGGSIMNGVKAPNDCARRPGETKECSATNLPPITGPNRGLTSCDQQAVNTGTPGGGDDDDDDGVPILPPTILVDIDGDGFYAKSGGDDCDDSEILVHPYNLAYDYCPIYYYFEGRQRDVNCDGIPDNWVCYNVEGSGTRILAPDRNIAIEDVGGVPHGTLPAGSYIYPGEGYSSPDGRFALYYQFDGNLVLYNDAGAPLWHTWTYGTAPGFVRMREDGRLIVVNGSGEIIWDSGTNAEWAYLTIGNDGRVVIHRETGPEIWANGQPIQEPPGGGDPPGGEDPPGGGPPSLDGAHISFQASNGQYVVAEEGGGGQVNANRSWIGGWETFTLHDMNGGLLEDGDEVTFQSDNGSYLQAVDGGGGDLRAQGGGPWAYETFSIVNLSDPGQPVEHDDYIALWSVNGFLVCAEMGGGDIVVVNRTGIGGWETFRLVVH